MRNLEQSGVRSEYMDLIDGLPDLEQKLKVIQKFLRKVTRGKSLEKVKEMLPLLGFSIDDENIEYDFWDFSVKFPIEKCYNESMSSNLSESFIVERLSDVLSDTKSVENCID